MRVREHSLHTRLGTGVAWLLVMALWAVPTVVPAQEGNTVRGRVVFATGGDPVHGAVVLIPRAGRVSTTDEEGRYEITGLPPGTYEVLAQREHFAASRQTVTLAAGSSATADFELRLSPVHEHVTVTTSPAGETSTFESFNAVSVLDTFDITRNMGSNLGELLEQEPGVARRAFGPGSGRPIIRGFDGDRVLILQDGIRTGDLSSQSGDHGVTIDPSGLERVEVVRGPATLLYGSNAVGGVVNAISPAEALRSQRFSGTRGQFTSDAGSANALGGAAAAVQHAEGNWAFWAGGGGRRTGDYDTPDTTIDNSATRLGSGRAGAGWFGARTFASAGYQGENARHGIPFAGDLHGHDVDDDDDDEELDIRLDSRRDDVRFDFGLRSLRNRFLDSVRVSTSYLRWRHDEVEIEDDREAIGTAFENDAVVVRAEFHQKPIRGVSGRFGVWGQTRDFAAVGEEALAPPTEHNAFAAFAYQEVDLGRVRLQFGGRLERNSYRADARDEDDDDDNDRDHDLNPPEIRDRDFTGVSASTGLHVDLDPRTAFVVNVSRSYRAPALEELYNFGPHVGNLSFEVGNSSLSREANLGLDASLKHRSARARGEFNVYVYSISDFVFPALTGEEEDGLPVVEFDQADSRFVGFDAKGTVELTPHLFLAASAGHTTARLTGSGLPLPRIPPFHGRVALDTQLWNQTLTVTPELVFAAAQNRVFGEEQPTGGYGLLNLQATYVRATPHVVHIFAIKGFNLNNREYRNHTSFIKERAAEIGRGVRFTYTMRFF